MHKLSHSNERNERSTVQRRDVKQKGILVSVFEGVVEVKVEIKVDRKRKEKII